MRFGNAELRDAERRLLVDGRPVELGARAWDVLVALVQRRNRVVSRQELLDLVWPGLAVEDHNLSVQIAGLRKVLGAAAITTVPGRGYRFTLPEAAPADALEDSRAGSLGWTSDLVGRADDVEAVTRAMEAERLISIVGASGMGKTTLARSIADGLGGALLCWTDIASSPAAADIHERLAEALAIDLHGTSASKLVALLASLRFSEGWIVLDNAEHAAGPATHLIRQALQHAPKVRWLVTSQRPLGVDVEWIRRLQPLALPEEGASWPESGRCAAVELLRRRVQALRPSFRLDQQNGPAAAELCRRLDGLPLAIEMAAARVPVFGVQGTLEQLARLPLRAPAGFDAPERHRSLHAALSWSYGVLDGAQRRALRWLGVFEGGFTAGLAADLIGRADGLDVLSELVERSLVQADEADPPRYRLLETAREFALAELESSGELRAARAHHACVLAAAFEPALADYERLSDLQWLLRHAAERGNVRSALQFSTSQGDAETTAQLVGYIGLLAAFCGAQEWPPAGAMELVERAAPARRLLAVLWNAMAHHHLGALATSVARLPPLLAHFRAQGDAGLLARALALSIDVLKLADGRLHEVPRLIEELLELDASALSRRMHFDRAWARIERLWYGQRGEPPSAELLAALRDLIVQCEAEGRYQLATRAYCTLSDLLLCSGDLEGVRRTVGAMQVAGGPRPPRLHAVTIANGAAAAALRGERQTAHLEVRQALRLLPNFQGLHFVFYFLAHVEAAEGRYDRAALLLGYVDAAFNRIGARLQYAEMRARDETLSTLAKVMQPEAVRALLQRGAALHADQAVALALEL